MKRTFILSPSRVDNSYNYANSSFTSSEFDNITINFDNSKPTDDISLGWTDIYPDSDILDLSNGVIDFGYAFGEPINTCVRLEGLITNFNIGISGDNYDSGTDSYADAVNINLNGTDLSTRHIPLVLNSIVPFNKIILTYLPSTDLASNFEVLKLVDYITSTSGGGRSGPVTHTVSYGTLKEIDLLTGQVNKYQNGEYDDSGNIIVNTTVGEIYGEIDGSFNKFDINQSIWDTNWALEIKPLENNDTPQPAPEPQPEPEPQP